MQTFSYAGLFVEKHDIETPGGQRQPGRTLAQEKACQSPQRPEPRVVQEQSPPPAFRSGEQPPSGTLTWQEEEEIPEQEALNGEFQIFYLHRHTVLCAIQ